MHSNQGPWGPSQVKERNWQALCPVGTHPGSRPARRGAGRDIPGRRRIHVVDHAELAVHVVGVEALLRRGPPVHPPASILCLEVEFPVQRVDNKETYNTISYLFGGGVKCRNA